jgi:hypothetical protein
MNEGTKEREYYIVTDFKSIYPCQRRIASINKKKIPIDIVQR